MNRPLKNDRQRMINRRTLLTFGATTALFALSARAAQQPAIKALQPGEFLWHPELSPDGPVVIIVSLTEQLVHVYRNGVEIGVSTCSTGKPGHRTPTGVFTILQKRKKHFSSTYNNAPMPNMQRLTWRGVALHAGNLPGYPASHGCIRLPLKFSKLVFGATHHGTPVIIVDKRTAPADVTHPGLLIPDVVEQQAKAAVKKVSKKKAPTGWATEVRKNIASIMISGADRKAYLMRNGEIEFETPIRITRPNEPLGTHVYALIGPSADGRHLKWLSFGIGGSPNQGTPVSRWSDETLARIELPDRRRAMEVAETLRPGTTLLVTDFAATPETRTGPDFVVITQGKTRP
ncbi:MAG: L,D-transpeptidase [Boseongicola sp.]